MADLVLNGDTSGSITLKVPAIAGTAVVTMPSTSGTLLVAAGGSYLGVNQGGTGVGTLSGVAFGNGTSAFSAATPAQLVTAFGTTATPQFGSLGVGTAASGTTGEIRATNNITAYYSSDVRLKENVQTIANAVDKVVEIGGVTFDWTDEYVESKGGEDGYFIQKSDFGVIAQDVEAVFPLAVRKREDGSLAVDYPKLVALAFAAIAELKAEVDALKGK